MSDSNRTPDASATAQQRAGATEDYGGVPISEEELAQVWTTGEGDERSGENTGNDSAARTGGDTHAGDDTVVSGDAGESGDIKPEVPSDDPQPAEPA